MMELSKTVKKWNEWINHEDQSWIWFWSILGTFAVILTTSLTVGITSMLK